MYCKYCGSRITADTAKCVSCGANIDLNDGGQSFFDDNELNAWQSGGVSNNAQSSVPRTEMREPLPPSPKKADFEAHERASVRPRASVSVKGSRSHRHAKKKKSIAEYLNLSSSNKLIIFCIASALAIVLLVVAIIAVLNGGEDKSDKNTTQENVTGYTQQTGNNTEQNTPQPAVTEKPAEEQGKAPNNQEGEKAAAENMTEIKDVKILDKDKKEIPYSASVFRDETEALYVCVDAVLKHEGYKDGRPNGNDSNRIIYEHKTSGKVIEIVKQTDEIWVKEPGGTEEIRHLEGNSFSIKDDIYVPIVSFLVRLGYDKGKIIWEEKDKTLYFSK